MEDLQNILCEGEAPLSLETETDEALVRRIRSGDTEAEAVLYTRYKPMVRGRARAYFLAGGDREDIIQEGMIGLYKAVCDYRFDKQTTFYSFAWMCVTRRIIVAVKQANGKRHIPLNSCVSLQQTLYDEGGGSESTLADVLRCVAGGNPEESLIDRENYEAVARDIQNNLTKLEKQVLQLYLEGFSYQQIGDALGRSAKCVDNAIQRVKKKLEDRLRG